MGNDRRVSVDADRLRDLTLELVEVESPTGDTAEVSRLYGQRLRGDRDGRRAARRAVPEDADRGRPAAGGPSPGRRSSSTATSTPCRSRTSRRASRTARIYGRGTADMKGALACFAEAVRGCERFPGELVIVAVGLHESPLGRGQDLTYLLGEHGFTADLGVVGELGATSLRGRARRLRDLRDHDPPRRRGHARADDRGRHAQPEPRRRPRDRGDPRAQRGAGRGRARVDRAGVVLPRRGARRRLLQPPPGRVPARRHAPLGAGEHAGAGGGRVPRAARADRRRVRLRDRPRPARSRAVPTGSIPSTGSWSRRARHIATSRARSCP